jgi:hypothetical protein
MANNGTIKPAVVAAGLCFSLIWASCDVTKNPCLLPTLATVNVHCLRYDAANGQFVDTALVNANFSCLDIDSARFWYYGAKRVSSFSLVLAPQKDTVRWTLQVDSGFSKIDTFYFVYESKLMFYSNACGYSYTYQLKEVPYTRNNLDSCSIINPEIGTKPDVQNFRIYF